MAILLAVEHVTLCLFRVNLRDLVLQVKLRADATKAVAGAVSQHAELPHLLFRQRNFCVIAESEREEWGTVYGQEGSAMSL